MSSPSTSAISGVSGNGGDAAAAAVDGDITISRLPQPQHPSLQDSLAGSMHLSTRPPVAKGRVSGLSSSMDEEEVSGVWTWCTLCE